MPVKYVLVERGNPGKPTVPKKFYAQHKSTGEITLRQLTKQISARSTVSAADTMAVLESLLEIVPEQLAAGNIVRLGDFGSFSASITSEGADTAEDFRAALIKAFSIRFRAGKELNRAVAGIDYQKDESSK